MRIPHVLKGLILACAVAVPAVAQDYKFNKLAVQKIETGPAQGCPDQATTLHFDAYADLTTVQPENAVRLRVRRGGTVEDVTLSRPQARTRLAPSQRTGDFALDAAGLFVQGKKMDLKVILCGVFPEMTFHQVHWGLQAEDRMFQAQGAGVLPAAAALLSYDVQIGPDGTTQILSLAAQPAAFGVTVARRGWEPKIIQVVPVDRTPRPNTEASQ